MNTHDIELPPLPDPIFISDHRGDGEYFEAEDMQDYARAAIEADRKRRGEPVGSKKLYAVACLLSGRKGNQYITSGTLHTRFADSEEEAKGSAVSFALEEKPDLAIDQVLCMEVRAPQPAEPVNSQREAQNYADDAYNAGWNDAKAQPAEPVKVPSDADAKHVRDFINCDGMGAVIVEGPQYSAVVRALLARYGRQPANPTEVK